MHPANPSIQKSVEYFRSALQIRANNFTVYREPGTSVQQTHYNIGSNAYHKKEWLKAIDNFEQCFKLYKMDLEQCRTYCEDVLFINVTGVEFGKLSGDDTIKPDTMDSYALMAKAVEVVVQCRAECYRKVSTINGVREKGYLASIFNFLQFAYYSGKSSVEKLKQFLSHCMYSVYVYTCTYVTRLPYMYIVNVHLFAYCVV